MVVSDRFQRRAHHYARLKALLLDVGEHGFRRVNGRRDHRLRILLLPVTRIQVIRQLALNSVRTRRRVRIGLFSLHAILLVVDGGDRSCEQTLRARRNNGRTETAAAVTGATLGNLDIRLDRRRWRGDAAVGDGRGEGRRRFRVLLDVLLHRLFRVEGLVADRTLVHLLAVVRDLVQLEHVVVAERLAADLTGIGLLAGVGARVHLQLLRTGETLFARLAHVRLLAGVRAHVYHQLAALDERLGAYAALVRPFAGMDAHVTVQFAAVLERAAAHVAFVRPFLRVDTPVDAEVLLHRKRFAAVLALVRLLTCVGAIVARQPRWNGERFAALVAAIRIFALLAVGSQVILVHVLLRKVLLTDHALVLSDAARRRRRRHRRGCRWPGRVRRLRAATSRRGEHRQIRAAHQTLHRVHRF